MLAAFEGLLKDKAYPSYFLYLDVDPKSIDINIHPTKTEIKFDDEHALYTILRSSIKHSLGQFNVAPVLDFDRDATLDTPYEFSQKGVTPPKVEVDPNFNPFKGEGSSYATPNFRREKPAASWESLYNGLGQQSSSFDQVEFESDEVSGKLVFFFGR